MAVALPSAYRPHRAYRRVAKLDRVSIATSLVLIVLLEVALVLWADELSGGMSYVANGVLGGAGTTVWEPYALWTLGRTSFEIAAPETLSTVTWLVAALGVGIVLLIGRRIMPPIRIWLLLVLATVALSASYVLIAGNVGFGADEFSRLYVTTAVTVWLLLPPLCGLLAFTLPLSTLERIAFVVFCLGLDVLMSEIRYGVFLWLLASAGPVPMPTLYLLFGPLLDFVYVTGAFAVVLFISTRRIENGRGDLVWQWM